MMNGWLAYGALLLGLIMLWGCVGRYVGTSTDVTAISVRRMNFEIRRTGLSAIKAVHPIGIHLLSHAQTIE